jgi:hypothetical protein
LRFKRRHFNKTSWSGKTKTSSFSPGLKRWKDEQRIWYQLQRQIERTLMCVADTFGLSKP